MKKYGFAMGAVLVLLVMLTACGRKNSVKYLVMGTNVEISPFALCGGADNSAVVGFDVDVAQAIAEKMGMPLKVVDLEFDQLLPALAEGKVDLVMAGLTMTEERARLVDFSDPYYNATQAVLLLADGVAPMSKEDLRDRKLAVQSGTLGEVIATEMTRKKKLRSLPSALNVAVALMNSQSEFALLDEQPVINLLKQNPELMRGHVEFDEILYGVAVKKGNAKLLATVNETLAEIQADGRYDQLIDQWILQLPEVAIEAEE